MAGEFDAAEHVKAVLDRLNIEHSLQTISAESHIEPTVTVLSAEDGVVVFLDAAFPCKENDKHACKTAYPDAPWVQNRSANFLVSIAEASGETNALTKTIREKSETAIKALRPVTLFGVA